MSGGNGQAHDPTLDDPVLAEWAAEVATRLAAGDPVDLGLYRAQDPRRAERLGRLLPTLVNLAHVGTPDSPSDRSSEEQPLAHEWPEAGMLGDFRLVREIGRGGMGVVYEAVQRSLGRRVAVKVLPATGALDARQVKRFEVEAQAAALLQHSRIVPVYAVGCERGVPYYAMQLIDGCSLAAVIRGLAERDGPLQDADTDTVSPITVPTVATNDYHPAGPGGTDELPGPAAAESSAFRTRFDGKEHVRAAAVLGLQAAEALAYAHAQGVVHRDIKPANLLVDPRGDVWITDFGLARIEANPTMTSAGVVVGTLRYMSPEQAGARRAAIDHRTDVYSLGASLYELLTLRPVIPGRDGAEILRRIAEHEPTPVRALNAAVPVDLQTIVLKALTKEPGARYASAGALAEDLRRFLAGEPILASPPSAVARLRRWVGRHRPAALAAASAAMAAAVFAVWAWHSAPDRHALANLAAEHQDIARENERLGQRNRYLARSVLVPRLRNASLLLKQHQVRRCRELVRTIEAGAEGFHRGEFAWNYVRSRAERALVPIATEDRNEAWPSPDGKMLVVLDSTGRQVGTRIDVLDRFTLRRQTSITVPGVLVGTSLTARISPDSRILWAIEHQSAPGQPQRLWAWELASGRLRAELRLKPDLPPVNFVPLAAERVLIFYCPEHRTGHFEIWRLADDGFELRRVGEVTGGDQCWCFPSGDGRTLAVADVVGPTGRIRVFDVLGASFGETTEAMVPKGMIIAGLISTDGRLFLGEDEAHELAFWELATGRELHRYNLGRFVMWYDLYGSPDSTVATELDRSAGTVTFWDRDRGRAQTIGPAELQGKILHIPVFAPDGSRFATTSQNANDKVITVWDARARTVVASLADAAGAEGILSFTPDGRELCIHARPSALLWRIDACAPAWLAAHADEAWAVAFSPKGRLLASGSDDTDEAQTIKLWNAATGAQAGGWFAGEGTVSRLAFSPDGRTLASAHLVRENNVRLWDVATGTLLATLPGHTLPVRSVAFSPDGSRLATCDADVKEPDAGTVRLWDARAGAPGEVLERHAPGVRAVAFSPDGTLLARCGADGVRVWELASGRQRAVFPGAIHGTVAFSPDGETLAVSPRPGRVELRSLATSDARAVLKVEKDELLELAFAPDGSAVAAAGESGVIRLFDVLTGEELLSLEGHTSKVHGLAFSRDGSTLASCSHDGDVRLWPADPAAGGGR